jgi:hypothetical protein
MLEKNWNEMYKINVKPYCETRDDIKYLNWAMCKKLLHENGAEVVRYEPLINENGSTLFMSNVSFADKSNIINRCYEVRVKIVIDDKEYIQNYPLLNGTNPVKDNSLNQLRVANAQARAFVKGVAINTGLGFELWCDNDESTKTETAVLPTDMFKLKTLAQEEYTNLLTTKQMSGEEIATKLNLSGFDSLKAKFSQFDELYKFITDLQNL